MKKLGVVLLGIALVAGMVGCFTPFRMQYQLTISSTEGGEVTTPGEGIFTYWEGSVVNLVAEAGEGYSFVNWTGDACACNIGNINAASTNITMNNGYSIIASFAQEISENLEIRDWYDLDAIRDNLGGNHTLMNDLDSTTPGYTELASPTANEGKGWQPIGTLETLFDSFTGSFNGQDYEIRDLFINRPDEQYVGLFGVVDEGACIEDIGLVNADVTAYQVVGGLVGENTGTVSNSHCSGSVTGESVVGSLVGENTGTVNNSYSSCNVTGEHQVGGLVGVNYKAVNNCYSTGSVAGSSSVGGLVGYNEYATVSNSYSTGNVTGVHYIGGLVGDNWDDTVSSSFWDTETSGQSTSAGGTGKNTTEMQDITTFSGATWDIIAVASPSSRNPVYTWNIVDDETYPFLSWQPIS